MSNSTSNLLTEEVPNVVLTKVLNKKKTAGLDKIPPVVLKTRKIYDLLHRFFNAVYKQNTVERLTKG